MEIVILTCVYKRTSIFKVFLLQFKYLCSLAHTQGHSLKLVVAGNNLEDSENFILVEQTPNAIWKQAVNKPLGRKWNNGLSVVKAIPHTHVLILGSDDLISLQTLDFYLGIGNNFDFVGILDMYLLNSVNGEFMFWPGYFNARKGESLGAGRLLSKSLLEQLNYVLWENDLASGLDASMTTKLAAIPHKQLMVSCKNLLFLLDIKSEENIWSYQTYRDNNYEHADKNSLLLENIPLEVIAEIRNLQEAI